MRTNWHCRACGKRGTLRHPKEIAAINVLGEVGLQHEDVNPRCADSHGIYAIHFTSIDREANAK